MKPTGPYLVSVLSVLFLWGCNNASRVPTETQAAQKSDPDNTSIHRARGLLEMGYQAERAGDYGEARSLYGRAVALDSTNPVPRRYLAELLRFHLGEWSLAEEQFLIIEELTREGQDPLSRAVALQGIGKIALWRGESRRGLESLEASMDTRPTPLSARHLADYWHGQEDLVKAFAYADQAFDLAPNDPYNRVFYAAFMALKGEAEEAEAWLDDIEFEPGQAYNRACTHALLGHRQRALDLLESHFRDFETVERVRSHEKQVARQDPFFASLWNDASFRELTRTSAAPHPDLDFGPHRD